MKKKLVPSSWLKEAQTVSCLRSSLAGYAAQCHQRASQEAWATFVLPCFLSHRGTWKEKCGGWQLTLSCPSVQPWAMIKLSGYGNYPPSTACWQCASSKKVHAITLHICKSIYKQQNVVCSFICSSNISRVCLSHAPRSAREWEFNVLRYRRKFQKAGLIYYFLHFPCIAQTFATWGQYVLLLLMESYGNLLKHIRFPECCLSLCLTASNNWFCYWKTKVSFIKKKIVNIKKWVNLYLTPMCTRTERYTRKYKLVSSCYVSGTGDPTVSGPISSVRGGQELNRAQQQTVHLNTAIRGESQKETIC